MKNAATKSHVRSDLWSVLDKTELPVLQRHQIRGQNCTSALPRGQEQAKVGRFLYTLPSGVHPRSVSSSALSRRSCVEAEAGWRPLLASPLLHPLNHYQMDLSLFIKKQSSDFFKCKKFNVSAFLLHYFFLCITYGAS